MNRIVIGMTAVSLAALFNAGPLDAQQRWTVELRGSGAISTQDEVKDEHENGAGFEANVQYRFLPHLAAYAGWGYTYFNAIEAIAGPDMDLEETGYVVGLRFEHPLGQGSRVNGWVRTGATVSHLELENDDGEIVEDSGHGLGWDVAAGLAVPFGGRWSMTPGVRYHSLSRDLNVGSATSAVELRLVAFELGITRRF